MKKSFLILLCVLLAMSLMFVACKKDKGEDNTEADTTQHTHTYDDSAWSSDQTNHWHAATCEHTSEQKDLAAHADANGDGVCDVCAYVMCAHTFEKSTWTTDATNHWHASTCAHDVKKDLAAHADTDNDGYCDTCKYDLCANTFAEKWESNSIGHWHVCTDGHGRKSEVVSHTGMDDDGICDVCGYGAHDHTWSEVYKYDADGHWQVTSCSTHNAVSGEKAEHADANGDFKCDTCGCVMHEHTYKDDWSSSETGHWHDASCGHDVKTEAEAHIDNNKDGLCDVCSYVTCSHTYEEKWSYDGENHYHKADCGCLNIPNADVEAHTIKDAVCTVCGYKAHTVHTYEDGWTSDETSHWHAATCGCDLKNNVTPHTGMADGICDVCKYGDHTHAWADEWSSDGDKHWHASTCQGHDPIKKDDAAHTGMEDGICDICKYGDHAHTWSDWMYDDNQHWHKTTCEGHTAVIDGKGNHVDTDNDGDCDICGRRSCNHSFDLSKWESDAMSHWHPSTCGHNVVQNLAAHDSDGTDGACSVCGSRNIINDITSDKSAGLVSDVTVEMNGQYSSSNITYSFGNGYTYLKETDGDGQVTEYWNYLISGGAEGDRIYSIMKSPWFDGMNSNATLDDLKGYLFSGNEYVGWGNMDDVYGVENFLYNIYKYAHEEANGVVSESYDSANNEYVLSFQCITGDTEYGTFRQVKVHYSFDSNNVITSLKIEADVYYDVADPNAESTEGKDYILYPSGAVKLLDGAETDGHTTMVVKQTVGERNATPAHDLNKILMSDFTLTDENGSALGDSLSAEKSTGLVLKITGITPDTAELKYDSLTVKAYLDGEENQWNYNAYFDSETGELTLTFYSVGDWEIDVISCNVTKTLNITVTLPATTSLTPLVTEDGWWFEEMTEVTIAAGDLLTFKAQANDYADDGFTASCEGGSIVASSTYPGAFIFTADEEGTYVITLTSTANPSVTTTLTVTVGGSSGGDEEKTPADILNGKWECSFRNNGDHAITVVFEPDYDGATSGYVTITDEYFDGSANVSLSGGYLYGYKNGWLSITYYDGEELEYELDLYDGVLSLVYADSNYESVYEEMTYAGGSGAGTTYIGAWYEDPSSWDNQSAITIYDSNANIYILETDEYLWWDYEYEDGYFTFYYQSGDIAAEGEIQDDGSLIIATMNGSIELTFYYYGE